MLVAASVGAVAELALLRRVGNGDRIRHGQLGDRMTIKVLSRDERAPGQGSMWWAWSPVAVNRSRGMERSCVGSGPGGECVRRCPSGKESLPDRLHRLLACEWRRCGDPGAMGERGQRRGARDRASAQRWERPTAAGTASAGLVDMARQRSALLHPYSVLQLQRLAGNAGVVDVLGTSRSLTGIAEGKGLAYNATVPLTRVPLCRMVRRRR